MGKWGEKKTLSKIAFRLVLAIIISIAALYLYNIVQWGSYPDFGFGFRTATGADVVGVVTDNGRRAGLEIGDRILEVNGKTFSNIKEFRSHMFRNLGERNTYLIERKGQTSVVTLQNVPIGFKKAFARSGFLYVLGLCYVLIGTLVFLMKPHQKVSWIFFVVVAALGLYFAFLYRIGSVTPPWLETFHILAYAFAPALFIHLALNFPEERLLVKKRPYIQVFPYIISTTVFASIRSLTPTMTDAPKTWLIICEVYLAFGVLVLVFSCLHLRLRSQSEIVKTRSRMILLGTALTASLPLMDLLSSAFLRVYILPGFNYYLPFFVIFPAFIGYSIVKHDLFDIDAIIKRTYGYMLTTISLAGIYGLFVLISNVAFGGFEFAKSRVFPLVFILAVVFLFNPIRNRVQRFIDRVFYRLEYDYQETVGKISETMRSLLNLAEIGRNLMRFSLQPMFVDAGSVMLLNSNKTAYECLIQEGHREEWKSGAGGGAVASEVEIEKRPAMEAAGAQPSEREMSERSIPLDEPLMQKMAAQKKEVTIYDIQEDPFFESERKSCEKAFDRLGATLLIPLIYEDELTGLISLGRKKSGKFYRREDINLLNTLANQGAVAIQNARMVEEVVEKERMEEELSIARDLQISMLPAACPQIEGFQIAAVSLPAREVGGDFYDFIEMGEDKVGLLVGDVTGKSVSGALVMSSSRSVFRMLSEEELGVGEIMIGPTGASRKTSRPGCL
jgi:GAF domain-containing protein